MLEYNKYVYALIVILIPILGGILGWYMDTKRKIDDKSLFYLVGFSTGFVSASAFTIVMLYDKLIK